MHSTTVRNSPVVKNSAGSVPRNGTSNQNTASARQMQASTMPTTKYGSSLPSISSSGWIGVDTSSSIVPRSHSRAIVRDESCDPTMAMTRATTPGMMKLRLTRSSLNHTLARTSTGVSVCTLPPRRRMASS